MDDVIVVGDGPAGLTAALYLAKNSVDVHVFGGDETSMHAAYLYNYPGIDEIHGSNWTERVREQCRAFDAALHKDKVSTITDTGDGFTVQTADGDAYTATYLVLAHGPNRQLADDLGLVFDGNVVETDKYGRTSIDRVYAGGWVARDQKIQAVISAGDGAAIALDILEDLTGEDGFHDFDMPED